MNKLLLFVGVAILVLNFWGQFRTQHGKRNRAYISERAAEARGKVL